MNTINAVFLLVLCLAASTVEAADDFTSDSPSPLKLTHHVRPEDSVIHFAGTVRIAGQFFAAWEGFDRKPHYLRVKFRPDTASTGLLPHATGAGAVEELLLTNSWQAAAMLLGADSAAKLLAKTLLSAEGNATVTIGEYQTVVECDHRWYLARLVAVTASRDIAVAAGESQHSDC
jgi:hypothetical protein